MRLGFVMMGCLRRHDYEESFLGTLGMTPRWAIDALAIEKQRATHLDGFSV